jgi:hypothetical protein
MNLGTTVKIAGGLLPMQLLERLGAGDATLPGGRPADYHEESANDLNQAINRAWAALSGRWAGFKAALEALPETDRGTSLTRERWLLPLFQELGYGRLPAERTAMQADGREFAISHRWGSVPVHLVGGRVSLDKRLPGERGAAASAPHGLVQDLLNSSDAHLWAFLSNGKELRILRDHRSLTRQAYVSFDLEAMFDGEQFSAFRMLYLLCHQSRVEAEELRGCWLEKWVTLAQQDGVRALDRLRAGVEKALEAMGRGFVAHRGSDALRERLKSGDLSTQEYYRQLLRLVYRLIFLFVAEDRDLLLVPTAPEAAKARFRSLYATRRLRSLALKRRGGPHGDGWQALRVLMTQLDRGNADLALPALGSFLWRTEKRNDGRVGSAIADLDTAGIANEDLYAALRALCVVQDGAVRRPVDWAGVQADELGSIYEALMERVPRINVAAGTFELASAAGNERKTTGSYYTPSSLVDCLLDSALDPVLEEAARNAEPEKAILALSVVDPACGSGHFLVAAARRIAHRLARVRSGGIEPSPPDVQHALRDVVGRCIYGVDLNPMAVELCKVSLWMEAIEPGKPLSFLDSHIRHGNALIGATPELMDKGIPDEAWEAIEGDDKEVAKRLKKENRNWKQTGLFVSKPAWEAAGLAALAAQVEAADDTTVDAVEAKEKAWQQVDAMSADARALADLWCAAFVWPKQPGEAEKAAPVRGLWETVKPAPARIPDETRRIAGELAKQYHFFHWNLAFPRVFERGGFDVVLGNPPWERVKLQEQEFFAATRKDIVEAPNKGARAALIQRLSDDDPELLRAWEHAQRVAASVGHFLTGCGRYPLCGGGDVNTSSVFTELACSIVRELGRLGVVVPTSLLTDDTTKAFPQSVVGQGVLVSAYDFENSERLFPSVRPHQHFVLLTINGRPTSAACDYAFFLTNPSQLDRTDARIALSAVDIALLNPNTRTIPVFRTSAEAKVTKAVYRAQPLLKDDAAGAGGDPWGLRFLRMFDMASDSASGFLRDQERMRQEIPEATDDAFRRAGYVPLFDAKMAGQYQHRAASVGMSGHQFRKISKDSSSSEDLQDPSYEVAAAYWVDKNEVVLRLGGWQQDWLLGFKDVTGITSTRLSAFAFVPRVGVGHPFPIVFLDRANAVSYAAFAAYMNSLLVEFLLRQKMQGLHVTYFLIKQLPAPTPSTLRRPCPWDTSCGIDTWLSHRVAELSCTSWTLENLAGDLVGTRCAYRWDEERRLVLRAEIDAAIFHLFQLSEGDVQFIIGTLEKVARKDERMWGRTRTEEETLQAYRKIAEAARTGVPYQTRLDPPPADPRVAHPARGQA